MIVWNPRGLYLITVLEKGPKFNAGYYIAERLDPWSQWRSIKAVGNERKLLVHADKVLRILPSYQLSILMRIE
jgi:hypothetical protein